LLDSKKIMGYGRHYMTAGHIMTDVQRTKGTPSAAVGQEFSVTWERETGVCIVACLMLNSMFFGLLNDIVISEVE
jgi:hypothetical protein